MACLPSIPAAAAEEQGGADCQRLVRVGIAGAHGRWSASISSQQSRSKCIDAYPRGRASSRSHSYKLRVPRMGRNRYGRRGCSAFRGGGRRRNRLGGNTVPEWSQWRFLPRRYATTVVIHTFSERRNTNEAELCF